nr:retrotransposon protein, putative, Ty3-gypsy subclass [Tanacetum cinerariifolium]
MQIASTLTDEALRNEKIKKNHEKRGNRGEPSKDRNERDDNKKTRMGNAFPMTVNPVRRGYTGTKPKCTTCTYHHPPKTPYHSCFNCNHSGHFTMDCRVVPRNVNPINTKNLTASTCYEYGSTDHIKSACPRLNHAKRPGETYRTKLWLLGAEEACQNPNIITGTFTLNDHYATTLFDFGADYSFISTTFIPLLDIEPSDLGFSYEIKITSGQLVEIDKVIKGCKLEIKGYVFEINLIPFGSGSFDVIIRMDWLSDNKAEIICHKKVVRLPLLDRKVLRVLGEKLKEKMRQLMSAKANDKKQEEIIVVRNFLEFLGHVINGDRIHVDPSKIKAVKNWKALRTPSEKSKTFDWGEEQENAFKTLKDKLCNAPVLALLDGPKDFAVCCDASGLGLGCVLMQRNKRRWIELFSNYDCEIRYHPGKAKVVVDALSRKERVKPRRVRAMNMTLQLSIKDRILAAQKEASDESAGLQKGLDEMDKLRNDGALYYLDRIWVPLKGDVRTLIMEEAYKSKYSIHPGVDKMYYDLKDRYWWPGMKKDIAMYLNKCLTCLKVKAEHQRPSGLLQQPKILEWKWEGIAMDIVTKLPKTSSGHETVWVIVDRLTKSTHFLPMYEDYKMDRLARLYLSDIVARHGEPMLIISDRDRNVIPNVLKVSRRTKVQKGSMSLEARFKAVRDRQKSYADKRRKPLEFSVGDYVLLKMSPWKGMVRFRKKGKLAPRFVGPFEIIEKVGTVAYMLYFRVELDDGVHDTFHVSNLKKCLADPTLQVPLDEIQVDSRLNFIEEPVEILEREFKKLKRSRIAIVKVRWNSKRGPEFTWEREDQMKLKYRHLFSADNS